MKRFPAILLFFVVAAALVSKGNGQEKSEQQFVELRVYKVYDYDKQTILENYLKNALLPALQKMKIESVGVFTNLKDVNDHSVFVLIPYNSIDDFTNLNSKLAKDEEYQSASAEYFDRPLKDPIYTRIDSHFMKCFAGMPQLKLPPQSEKKQDRIFELRLYESHTEQHAAKKVEMFNEGEIQIMVDAKMGPVFFGETLIGNDVPNLIYMLSASDEDEHKEHWQAFLKHPKWKEMSKMEKYKDTVSKIKKTFLKPTSYSGI